MTKQLSRSLQIVHEVPPHVPLPVANYGGTERVVQSLVKGLEARGVNIQVRCSGDSFPDAEDPPQIPDGSELRCRLWHGRHILGAQKGDRGQPL